MLKVEYISPDGVIFDAFEMADGMTLTEAACTICPDSGGKFPVPTIAFVGSRPAVKSKGDWDFKLSDAKVQFRQLAMGGGGGGGSNPIQTVLQLAIIAAAAAATIWLGGAGGYFAGLGMSVNMANFAAGMVGVGITMLGTMLTGALFQNKLPQGQMGAMNAEQASPTYNINASGNQARLYQTEPELFGWLKFVPDFVANTWTEYVDNDQIGYFVYGVGRGEYEVQSLQFGETVFYRDGKVVEDSGYDIQAIEIIQPNHPVTIFPDNIISSSEVSGQQLFAPNEEEYTGAIGPYATNPPGTFTNRVSLDFVFQQGLGHYNDSGSLEYYGVWWRIEYRKIDDFGEPQGEWVELDAPSASMATTTPQRITKNYDVENGRYEVRVRRTNDTSGDGRSLDSLVWSAMRAMLPGTYEYPITCIALAVKANNALTQSASRQFSVIATRKLPLYNRKTKKWSQPQATRSWAAAVSHVLKCEWGGRLSDADIDLDKLWEIDERLQAKGWHYDSYIDGPYLIWNLLCEMCQSQLVIPRLVGPVISFIEDASDRTPVFALTPRNIMRNTFAVNYATWSEDTPDDVIVEYLDADYGFQQRDVTAILPESESKEPSSMDILGITNRSHAHSVAVAYAAHNRWQRISVECQIEALGRLINRGDICAVAHPRFKNTCAGAVDWWNESGLLVCVKIDYSWPEDKKDGYYIETPQAQTKYPKTLSQLLKYGVKTSKATIIEIDSENTLHTNLDTQPKGRFAVVDDNWYIAFTRQDGSIWGPCKIASISGNRITLDSGDYSTLLLQGQGNPFEFFTAGRDRQPTAWTLYSAREYQRLMVVDSVSSQDGLHYSLKLLNYDKRIYSYNNLPVPLWQGRGQLPDDSAIRQPSYLKGIIESENSIRVVWLTVGGASWYEVQYSHDNASWVKIGRTTSAYITIPVSPGAAYIRVRAGNDTKMSAWTKWEGNTLLAAPAKPNPQLSGQYKNGSANISWAAVATADKYGISLVTGQGNNFHNATQTARTYAITPEMQTGGPYRQISCNVRAINENGSSQAGTVVLSEPAPAKITSVNIAASGKTAVLSNAIPALSGITGYAIARAAVPNFNFNQAQELRQTASLPYSWAGLSSGSHYFRIAAKDAFYDNFHDPYQLNWSDAIKVEIA